MVLARGGVEGDSENRHRGADQWLYVVSGIGAAKVNGREVPLSAGTIVLIERSDTHEIRNTGRSLLKHTACTCHQPTGTRRPSPAGKR
jgi:mannose-6-phosphate isomerase-like protein (cupin superfamily)